MLSTYTRLPPSTVRQTGRHDSLSKP
jgi:hypothetical protein